MLCEEIAQPYIKIEADGHGYKVLKQLKRDEKSADDYVELLERILGKQVKKDHPLMNGWMSKLITMTEKVSMIYVKPHWIKRISDGLMKEIRDGIAEQVAEQARSGMHLAIEGIKTAIDDPDGNKAKAKKAKDEAEFEAIILKAAEEQDALGVKPQPAANDNQRAVGSDSGGVAANDNQPAAAPNGGDGSKRLEPKELPKNIQDKIKKGPGYLDHQKELIKARLEEAYIYLYHKGRRKCPCRCP